MDQSYTRPSVQSSRGESEDIFLHLAQDEGETTETDTTPPAKVRSRKSGYSLRQSNNKEGLNGSNRSSATAGREKSDTYDALHDPNGNSGIRDSENEAAMQSRGTRLGLRMREERRDRTDRDDALSARDVLPETPLNGRHRLSYSGREAFTQPRLYRVEGKNTLNEVAREDDHEKSSQIVQNTLQTKVSPVGSDSVDSQNAPSTVWDELDDLKSRINKLELTGKLPPSSAAAMSALRTGDRPRTATTAPTTVSSSPKQLRKHNTAPSEITLSGQTNTGVHPLLQSALAKAKMTLSPQLYRTLEASAADAMALAAITGNAGPQGTTFSAASIINGVTVSDRQIRRKADSMCRNLTDLCIALCDIRTDQPVESKSSPVSLSRQQRETPPSRYARRSIEPSDRIAELGGIRQSPNRSFSRLEDRRSSSLGLGSFRQEYQETYQKDPGDRSPSTTPKDYAAQYSVPGISHTRTRSSRFDPDDDTSSSVRAPSRAMTEVGYSRQPQSHRSEFHQRSPSLRETLAARRGNVGNAEDDARSGAQQPLYPVQSMTSRRFADRNRGPASEVGGHSSSGSRRLTSLEFDNPPSRLGSPLVRSESFSRQNVKVDS